MKKLNAWIAAEVRRQLRHPRLEQALLTNRGARYAWYRLRMMAPRVLIRTLLHGVELQLLALAAVPPDWMAVFLGYRTLTGLLSSLHWGALEPMRQTVRAHMAQRHPLSALLVIHNWLRATALVGLLGLLLASAWMLLAPADYELLSVFNLFGIACFGRLAFDLWARTLHSGIFAVRRVYRPGWSLWLPELLEIAILIVAFPRYALLAFPAMVVGGGVVRIALAVHYAKRAYRGSRLPVPTVWNALRARHVLRGDDLRDALKLLVSNATSQLDALIIMLLLVASHADAEASPLVMVYYVLRPLMAVAHGWVRVFYFDFKRIERAPLLFRERFRRLLDQTAWLLAAVVGLLVLGISTLLRGGTAELSLLSLVPFFVARSLFSLRQVEAFSYGEHRALLLVSAWVLTAVAGFGWLATEPEQLVLGASVALALGAQRLSLPGSRRPTESNWLGLPRWLAQLSACATPVQLHVVLVDHRLSNGARVARRIADALPQARVTRFASNHVLWFEPLLEAGARRGAEIAGLCGGTVARWQALDATTGPQALRSALERRVLPKELCEAIALPLAPGNGARQELLQAFRSVCPQGIVIDAGAGRIDGALQLRPQELRAILMAIGALARGRAGVRSSRVDVQVYAPGGEPEVIFVAPSQARPGAEFARRVLASSLRASTGL